MSVSFFNLFYLMNVQLDTKKYEPLFDRFKINKPHIYSYSKFICYTDWLRKMTLTHWKMWKKKIKNEKLF